MTTIDLSELYANPIVSTGTYAVKLTGIETQDVGQKLPLILVRLMIAPIYVPNINGMGFASIIHPTEAAQPLLLGFLKTFLIRKGKVKAAVGRFGSVRIKKVEYNGTEYGEIGYVYQRRKMLKLSSWLYRMDQAGELEWP